MRQRYKVEKTIDLLSSPGCVVLEGTVADLERDMREIRRLEGLRTSQGLYKYF